jgi:neutral ceramidase
MYPFNVIRFACMTAVLLGFSFCVLAADPGSLRAGVAKVDITPADPTGLANLWETRFEGVHDKIYVRALVLENGGSTAALLAVDTVEFADATAFVQRIAKETGIPTSNIILAATHNHNSPMVSLANAGGTRKNGPGAPAFVARAENDILAAVKQAKANLQPAQIGVGAGISYINVNRDLLTPTGYKLGKNPEGPSDRTVWVIKVETASGEPLALFMNYGVHAVVLGSKNTLLTGDLPGATSRFVEQYYNDKVVALWTPGAAGDQNPVSAGRSTNVEKNFALAESLGQILGEEVIRVANGIKTTSSQTRIWGAEKFVTCPGKKTDPEARARGEIKFLDANPVTFRMGLLMIDNIALTAVSAEIVAKIYQRLRKESPFTNTILVSLANGRIGYISDDATYDNPTYQVAGSPLKRGCGESTIVDGFLELMQNSTDKR